MSENIWDLADEILNSVSDAIKTDNYSGLSQKIRNSVNDATSDIRKKVNENRNTYNTYYDPNTGKYVNVENSFSSIFQGNSVKREQPPKGYSNIYTPKSGSVAYGNIGNKEASQYKPTENNELKVCSDNKVPGRISSYFKYIGGITGAALMSVPDYFATHAFVSGIIAGGVGPVVGFLFTAACGITGCSVAGIVSGKRRIDKNKRFKVYKSVIGNKGYCQIEDLAKQVDKSKKFVKRDLRKMIKERYFLEGHFANDDEIFVTSNDNYNYYLQAEENQKRLIEQKQESASSESNISRETSKDASSIVEEGREYIARIHVANSKIPGEEMTKKLNTMEDIMIRIFKKVEREPETSEELRRMMKYYLPTTVKLLDAYIEMDGQPSYGDNNIAKSKKEIEESLDIINQAFGNLFDSLFEDKAWDISSDINTMKTMMKQDGLTSDEVFKKTES